MPHFSKTQIRLLFVGLVFLLSRGAFPGFIEHENKEIIQPAPLPEFGKFVLDRNGNPATWLGKKVDGHILLEPINIILIDGISKSSTEAIQSLERANRSAGYKKRFGHSSGYMARIHDRNYSQIPQEYRMAFSNAPAWEKNNHGRFFGPQNWNGAFIFSGSFSRESFTLFAWIHHNYVSFEEAKQDFANKLIQSGSFIRLEDQNLENLYNSHNTFTGDHNGKAIVLKRIH